MKKLIFYLTLVVLPMILMVANAVAAGPGMGMGMGPPCGGPFPPCPVPVDGGVTLLVGAGIAYGTKKLIDSKRKNRA